MLDKVKFVCNVVLKIAKIVIAVVEALLASLGSVLIFNSLKKGSKKNEKDN